MTEYQSKPRVRSKIYREPLRVGTVAAICQVTNKTIFNWIRLGGLKTFTTHGGHNRVWPSDLHSFLDRNGIDVEFEFDDQRETRILIVGDRPDRQKLLRESFMSRFSLASVVVTQSEYEALLLIGEQKPHVLTWDLDMPRCDGVKILEFFKARKMNGPIHVALCHDVSPEKLKWAAFAPGVQETRTGTGLHDLLNVLATLISPQGPSPRSVRARSVPEAPPSLAASNRNVLRKKGLRVAEAIEEIQ